MDSITAAEREMEMACPQSQSVEPILKIQCVLLLSGLIRLQTVKDSGMGREIHFIIKL